MTNHKEKLQEMVETKGIKQTADILGISLNRVIDMLGLDIKTFDDIEFKPHPMGNGIQAVVMFDNGYGASVVQTDYSYGGRLGLYELAVLDKDGHITYNTPITEDVIGYLNHEKVTEKLIEIQDLKN